MISRIAVITRRKIWYPDQNGVVPWRWFYNIDLEGIPMRARYDSIERARKMAIRYGATRIIEAWKGRSAQ